MLTNIKTVTSTGGWAGDDKVDGVWDCLGLGAGGDVTVAPLVAPWRTSRHLTAQFWTVISTFQT